MDASGHRRAYVPDYKVLRTDGKTEIHIVVNAESAEHAATRAQIEATRVACLNRGWGLEVHTTRSLPQATERANLLALFSYRATCYADPDIARAARAKLSGRQLPFCALAAEIAAKSGTHPAQVTAALGHMLWHGSLSADLQQLIFVNGRVQPKTLVWLPISPEAGV